MISNFESLTDNYFEESLGTNVNSTCISAILTHLHETVGLASTQSRTASLQMYILLQP